MDKLNFQQYANTYLDEQLHFEKYIYEMQERLKDSGDPSGRLTSYCANALYFIHHYKDLLGEDMLQTIMKKVAETVDLEKKKKK